MEQPKNFMADEAGQNPTGSEETSAKERAAHAEAVAFVERHRDYLEQYARGAVRFEPTPPGLNTFAFNLETDTIYVNDRFYRERGLSDEKTAFAISHEAEHFLEKKALLAEPDGARRFARYLRDIKASRAYGLMDNCVSDVRENRAVIAKTSRETAEIEKDLYEKDLFPETDLTSVPKHIQFCDALLRESRVPDERCQIAPEVREKLDELRARKAGDKDFFELLTHPDTPLSLRLSLQNEYIWPVVKELLEKDGEDEERKSGGGEGGKKGEDGEKGKGTEGKGEKENGRTNKRTDTPDPNEVFKDAYDRAAKRGMPEAVPVSEVEKAFKEWREANKESPLEKADRECAKRLGVRVEDMQKYRRIAEELETIKNPETGVGLVEELRDMIRRIIARRLKRLPAPRYPVEEGEELVDPAGLVAEVKSGNLEPKVWETFETKEKRGGRFGKVEFTTVFDRSTSMNEGSGEKKREQQRAGVLGMEALKEIAELCEEERTHMAEPLEVHSEVFSFQADDNDAKPLKKMSKEFGERERIEILSTLNTAPGESTTDFVPLEAILADIERDEEKRKKIEEGEVKKIILVFTDGESADVARVKVTLKKLRDLGVVAVGIGITESGKAALQTYAPDVRLAPKAEDLPRVLGELLKEHLAEL